MNILLVSKTAPLDFALIQLIRGLILTGISLTVSCPRRPQIKWFAELNVKWIPLKFDGENEVVLTPFSGRNWQVIYYESVETAWVCQSMRKLAARSVVCCTAVDVFVSPFKADRETWANIQTVFTQADIICCTSESVQKEAHKYDLTLEKSLIIYPAVNTALFKPGRKKQKKSEVLRLASSGYFVWHNGLEYALSAVRNLIDRGIQVHCEIVGKGTDLTRLRYAINDLLLDEYVQIYASFSHIYLRDLLQRSDVYLAVDFVSALSDRLLNAMACSVPVVVTECPDVHEAIEDGKHGLIVPPRKPDSLADAIFELFSNPEIARQMGEKAHAQITNKFSLNHQVEQYLGLFESVRESE